MKKTIPVFVLGILLGCGLMRLLQPSPVQAFATYTYNSTVDGSGAVLTLVDASKNVQVINLFSAATITVTPLRTAPDPDTVYSGTSRTNAEAFIDAILANDGVSE